MFGFVCVPVGRLTVSASAYNEAVRSQQRQEEVLGFQKVPVRPPPPADWDTPESEDDDNGGADSIEGVGFLTFVFDYIY